MRTIKGTVTDRSLDLEDESERDLPIPCPACGGVALYLGTLGRKVWHRCRDCGTDTDAARLEA